MRTKTLFIALFLLSTATALKAQTDPKGKVYEMFDIAKTPSFPGGERAMFDFISNAIQYPQVARENGIQGNVALTFIVMEDGSLTDISILKDIGGGCGKEAIRVVQTMPTWWPGEANGVPVKVRYTLPVRFRLGNDESIGKAPTPALGPKTKEQTWVAIAGLYRRIYGKNVTPEPKTPFNPSDENGKLMLGQLESDFNAPGSSKERSSFQTLGQLADYFYTAQFAPTFYQRTNFKGKSNKLLSSRPDFDVNADGLGTASSIAVPQGIRVIFYSGKKFKGQKLELNATKEEINLPDLSNIPTDKTNIKNGGKGINWALNTRSVKIILPKNFPGKE